MILRVKVVFGKTFESRRATFEVNQSNFNDIHNHENFICFLLQSFPLLRGHQPAGQRGVDVHPEDREHGLRRLVHHRDGPQVGCIWPLEVLYQRLDLSGFRHRLRK